MFAQLDYGRFLRYNLCKADCLILSIFHLGIEPSHTPEVKPEELPTKSKKIEIV